MAAVLVNQFQAAVTTTATTTTITATTTPSNSLILLFGTAGGASGTFTAVSDTGGNTWTLPDPPKGGLTGVTNTFVAAAYVHNAASPGTITVTNNSVANRQIIVLEVSGLVNTTPDAATEDFTNAAITTTITSSAGTTTQTGDIVVGFVNFAGSATTTGVSAGWNTLTQPAATGSSHLTAAYKVGTAAAAEQCTFTGLVTGQRFGAGLLAFKATSGAAPITSNFFQMF